MLVVSVVRSTIWRQHTTIGKGVVLKIYYYCWLSFNFIVTSFWGFNDADIELYVCFFFSLDVSQNKMNMTFCCHSYKCFQNHEMSPKKYKTKKFYSCEILRSISTTVSEDQLIYLLLKLHNLTQTKNCCPNHLRKCWPLLH